MLSRLVLKIMIEFCSRRRLIVFLFILGIISLLIIAAENKLATSVPQHKDVTIKTTDVQKSKNGEECRVNENYTTMIKCAPCSAFQMNLNASYCMETGFFEKVKCGKSKTEAFKSCPKVGWIEARKFWTFESVTLVVGLFSYAIVFFRQRRLDKLLTDKINKQIASGI